MLVKVKLTAAWAGHAEGATIKVDAQRAAALVAKGLVKRPGTRRRRASPKKEG